MAKSQLLSCVARSSLREKLGIAELPPFYGYDLWNAYDFSWLDPKGKPVSAIAQFLIPSNSKYLIEAESFRFYLNAFQQTAFPGREEVTRILSEHLSECVEAPIMMELALVTEIGACELIRLPGICLDLQDIEIETYTLQPDFLTIKSEKVEETVFTDLFKIISPITGLPEWGSIQISYKGNQITHPGLLKYLISFRQMSDFIENSVEKIFADLYLRCQPEELTVLARFLRREGLDNNPCRSTNPNVPIDSTRCFRQ